MALTSRARYGARVTLSRLAIMTALLLSSACFDSDDLDAAECSPPASMVVECASGESCWVWAAGWSSLAQYADPSAMAAAVEGLVIAPTQDDLGIEAACFDLLGSDHHVCVVDVDCIGLLGRPENEVTLTQSECAPEGPWSFVGEGGGECWGVVDGVAVMLDLEH